MIEKSYKNNFLRK